MLQRVVSTSKGFQGRAARLASQGCLFADRDAVYVVAPGTLIDAEWLRQRAAWARKELTRLRRRKASVERDDEICIMVDLIEAANLCAEWMARENQVSRSCVGPFSPSLSMSGDSVRVNAGAEVFTRDELLGLVKSRTQRGCEVTVTHSYRGYIDRTMRSSSGGWTVVQPRIEWGGKNGPLRWTDANNVA